MRKLLFLIVLILLIILSGCNDLTNGSSDFNDLPVEIESVAKGELIPPGSEIEIEYHIEDTETEPDRLVVTLTGPNGVVISEYISDKQPLDGWMPAVEIEQTAEEGLYAMQFDFFIGEELFYSELREFFISSAISSIKSINSYPPVLYPGGGGLFHADTICAGEDCWLRWTMDGDVIAEGSVAGGYGSIEIEAPDAEGVYDLSLEVFPFPPSDDDSYGFESTIKKDIPLYVNTEQKSGITEFGPEDDFYTLFHFRGSNYNSADADDSGIEALVAEGRPSLAVRNGLFGYYLDALSGFTAEGLIVPVVDGKLESFSFMTSLIPYSLTAPGSGAEPGGLFFSGFEDKSFYIAGDVYEDGRLKAELVFGDEKYELYSSGPMLSENIYAAISLAVHPSDEELRLTWYLNGIPESEIMYPAPEGDPAPWFDIASGEKKSASSLYGSGSFKGLVDEAGVYHDQYSTGPSIDPEQFRRAMELEYGKFLMYAEGFDGNAGGLIFNSSGITVENSSLVIPPGAEVDFPPIYPGYEEVVFRIVLADASTGIAEAVFYVDGTDSEIVTVDFSPGYTAGEESGEDFAGFSLVFTADSVELKGAVLEDGEKGFNGDFSGVGYSIINNDTKTPLEIESILIIRKNIDVSEISMDGAAGGSRSLWVLPVGNNI